MNIVILAGGSGSQEIQRGLISLFGKDVNYSVITNLFDNGLSTGICRKIMDGDILGPSDLRKNQMLRHLLLHDQTELFSFLNERLSLSKFDFKNYIEEKILKIVKNDEHKSILNDAVNLFFSKEDIDLYSFEDFSVSNIIYSGLAASSNNSMEYAAEIMEKVLNIPKDSVICSSDKSLYLSAITESGHTILDEGDIVNWSNPEDLIKKVYFTDKYGNEHIPVLSKKAFISLVDADIIIYSCGTQWSSLIPTYMHSGFDYAIKNTDAKQYLIINAANDKDMYGLNGDKFLSILSNFLPSEKITLISSLDSKLRPTNKKNFKEILDILLPYADCGEFSGKDIISKIFNSYYEEAINSDIVSFDFDDTLWSRDQHLLDLSKENLLCINQCKKVNICSGNSYSEIKRKTKRNRFSIDVFTERGALKNDFLCLEDFVFNDDEINDIISIIKNHVEFYKISNRSNIILSIKPVDNRIFLIDKLSKLLTNLDVISAGKTTIEISKKGLNKEVILDTWFKDKKVTYVGDEYYEGGNDYKISKKTNFIKINSIKDTNILLKVLRWQN